MEQKSISFQLLFLMPSGSPKRKGRRRDVTFISNSLGCLLLIAHEVSYPFLISLEVFKKGRDVCSHKQFIVSVRFLARTR